MNIYELDNASLLREVEALYKKVQSEKTNLTDLERAASQKMPTMVDGGLRDVNKVIWPFMFSTGFLKTSPTIQFAEKNITVTQEAAFVATKIIKNVFIMTEPNLYEWVDTEDVTQKLIKGLSYSLSDPQSGRNFHRSPVNVEHIGNALYPTKMLARPLILPNSSLNVKIYQENEVDTYFTNFTIQGFRIRIEDAQELLGLVTQSY